MFAGTGMCDHITGHSGNLHQCTPGQSSGGQETASISMVPTITRNKHLLPDHGAKPFQADSDYAAFRSVVPLAVV